jgi:hypothetical protein
MDKKKILLELKRIKNLMGNDPELGLVISEGAFGNPGNFSNFKYEDMSKAYKDGTKRKSTFKIGKGTDYPFIYYFGNDEVDTLEVVEGTKIYKINSNTTSANIMPGVLTGSVTRPDGTVVDNQDYIEKDVTFTEKNKDKDGNPIKVSKKTKLCLPDKTFWGLETFKGRVYKFETPVSSGIGDMGFHIKGVNSEGITTTLRVFSLKMNLNSKVSSSTLDKDGKPLLDKSPIEKSIACLGGDNGWSWYLVPGLFFDGENQYNPKNPEMMDTRSEFGIWYDHYGAWLEIGIGIAAAFTGAGLATLMVEFLPVGSWLAATWTATSSTTRLSVFMQILCEGVMMSPIIDWKLMEGRTAEASLDMIFCLFPMISETGRFQKFLAGKYSKETAYEVAKKIKAANLPQIFTLAEQGSPLAGQMFNELINGMTALEQSFFMEAMNILAKEEGMVAMKEGFEEIVKNGGVLAKEWEAAVLKGNTPKLLTNLDKLVGPKAASTIGGMVRTGGKYFNPITARTFIPGTFVRAAALPFAYSIGHRNVWKLLSPEEQYNFDKNIRGWTGMSEYYQALYNIDPDITNKAGSQTINNLTDDQITKYAKGNLDELEKDPELKNTFDQATSEIIQEKGKEEVQKLIDSGFTAKLQQLNLKRAFELVVTKHFDYLGYTIYRFETLDPNQCTGTLHKNDDTKTIYSFKVTNDGKQSKFYINNEEITDESLNNNKPINKLIEPIKNESVFDRSLNTDQQFKNFLNLMREQFK